MAVTLRTLIDDIKTTLNRADDETINRIPNFIQKAQEKICRKCKTIGFEVYLVGTFQSGQYILAKPARWRRSISFNVGTATADGQPMENRNPILLRSYEYLRMFWPDDTQMDVPLFYSDYGFSHFLVAPTPDKNYPFELSYLEMPAPLTDANQTNWLTEYAPGALKYGALLESAPFLRDDERLPIWKDFYEDELGSIEKTNTLGMQDRSAKRDAD